MIIDSHIHIWHRKMLPDQAIKNYLMPLLEYADQFDGFMDFDLDAESPFWDYEVALNEFTESMDVNRIDRSIVLATDFGLVNEGRMSNEEYIDWLYGICAGDSRLEPFIGVDPNRGDPGLKMIERLVKKYEPRGIKVYPATGFFPDEDRFSKYWKLIDDLGLTVVTHAGMALPPLDERYCHPVNLIKVAERHPDMKIIIAHLGGKFHNELFDVMDKCENVYTDCSALQGWLPSEPDVVYSRLRDTVGRYPKRVVFGTDFPLYDTHYTTMQFIRLINEGDWGTQRMKEDLLGNNMARILGMI
ncbi:MAG: amidohydrolase [Methanomassiliicoccaceae archaeon]|jgi:predicted TIM-barrel fold metal-dependent hydrolase|nr:amidohydrolase [Methanomassiliicoccaceae archaeon]